MGSFVPVPGIYLPTGGHVSLVSPPATHLLSAATPEMLSKLLCPAAVAGRAKDLAITLRRQRPFEVEGGPAGVH